MKKVIDITWVEDKPQYLPSIDDELKEIQKDFQVVLDINEKNDTQEFEVIAENIPSDLVFCIDYNLKIGDDGINGDEVINRIRQVNNTCWIIFYSAKLNQEELRNLVDPQDSFTICVHRSDLLNKFRSMLEDGFF